jgi:hypothetical protein
MMSDHVLKVEMGEFTNYHLICNLDDAADCHQVCVTHPDGCDPMDVEGECVREVYRNGCTVAEWVNDGGIESVGFAHTVEIPVTYQWNASHDYPSIYAASVSDSSPPHPPALVPKFAVGDEVKTTFGDLRTVKEIVISYRVSNGGFWIEEMLSPVCSHTHTTCDECHERIER